MMETIRYGFLICPYMSIEVKQTLDALDQSNRPVVNKAKPLFGLAGVFPLDLPWTAQQRGGKESIVFAREGYRHNYCWIEIQVMMENVSRAENLNMDTLRAIQSWASVNEATSLSHDIPCVVLTRICSGELVDNTTFISQDMKRSAVKQQRNAS